MSEPRLAEEPGAAAVRRPPGSHPSQLREVLLFALIIGAIALPLSLIIDVSFLQQLDFAIVYGFRDALARGFVLSIVITLSAMAAGLVLGVLLAILSRGAARGIRAAIAVHVEVWRNTPILIQLFWIHFGLPLLTGLSTSVMVSGLIAMTLQASAYLTEVARAGIDAIPSGQWEAARALGLPPRLIWLKVILPQALRIMIPPGTNTLLSVFKGSAVLSVLSVGELMSVSQHIANYTFKPIETLSVVALLYFLAGKLFTTAMAFIERRARVGGLAMEFNLNVLRASLPLLLEGTLTTIIISISSLLLGAVVGLVLCAGRTSSRASLRWLASGFIDFFRTIPEMIPIIWLYACAPFLFKLQLDAMTIGIAALTLICSAFLAEVFRAGLLAIPAGQTDAAKALGLSRIKTLAPGIAPQAARVMMPPAMNIVADTVKCSSLLSVIGVAELAYQTATLSASSYRYMELYTAAGILYFALIFPVSLVARRYGARVQRR